MYIKEIQLKNIRNVFRDKTIDFNSGITALIGPNGCGKSTLFQSIVFSLTGKLDSTQKDFASNKDSQINLNLSDNTNIVRNFLGNAFDVHIFEDDVELLVKGKNGVFDYLSSKYNWDKFIFNNSIFLGQKSDIDLLLKPSSARDFLINILNLEIWNKFYYEASDRKKKLETDLENLDRKYLVLSNKRELLDVNIDFNFDSFNFEQTKETLNILRQRELKLNEIISNIDRNKKLLDLINSYDININLLKKSLAKIDDEIKDNSIDFSKEKIKLDKENKTKVFLESKLIKLKMDIDWKTKLISIIKSGKCPTCLSSFTDSENILLTYNKELLQFLNNEKTLNKKLNELDNRIEITELNMEEYHIWKDLNSKQKEINNKIKFIMEEKQKMQSDLVIDENIDYDSTKKELKELSKQISKIQKELSDYEYYSNYLERNNTEIKQVELELENITKEISSIKEDINQYEYLRTAYSSNSGIPKLFLETELANIEISINKDLSIISNDLMSIRFQTLNDGKDSLNLEVNVFGDKRNQASNISGGEYDRLRIATLTGLATYLNVGNFLLLDEPTKHCDEEGRNSFMDLLNYKRNIYDQIIISTHDARLTSVCDHIINLE